MFSFVPSLCAGMMILAAWLLSGEVVAREVLSLGSGGVHFNFDASGVLLALPLLAALWRSRRAQKPGEDHELRFGLQELPVALAVLDERGRLAQTNEAWRQLFGLDESSAKNLRFAQLIHPAEEEAEKARFHELQNNVRQSYEADLQFYTQDERLLCGHLVVSTLPAQVRETAVAKLSEGMAKPIAVARVDDITRTQRAETDLQAARKALHDLYTVVADNNPESTDRTRALLEMGCRHFGVETAIAGRVRGNQFEVLQAISPGERVWRGRMLPLDSAASTPSGSAVQNGVLVGMEHTLGQVAETGDWHVSPWQSHTEFETYLGAPIVVDGQLFGLLSFSSFEARTQPYKDNELEFLQLMADWLGGEIERQQARRQVETKQKELEKKQKELVHANELLEELATRDGLTELYNRRYLDVRLDEEVARARRYQLPLSLIMLDVDNFKDFNDTFGHPEGDEVLKTVAEVLKASVRGIDIVARYGGEEFTVVLPNTEAAGARILAERLRVAIEDEPWPYREITASLGVASLTDAQQDREALTALADGALYQSKEQGRNRVTHADDVASEKIAPESSTPESLAPEATANSLPDS